MRNLDTLLLLLTLQRIEHLLHRISRTAEIGITHLMVMYLLGRSDKPLSAGEVTLELGVHPSTLTPVLKQLSDKGLIARLRDSHDTRRACLSLTTHGSSVFAELGPIEEALKGAMGAAGVDSHTINTMGALAFALESRTPPLASERALDRKLEAAEGVGA